MCKVLMSKYFCDNMKCDNASIMEKDVFYKHNCPECGLGLIKIPNTTRSVDTSSADLSLEDIANLMKSKEEHYRALRNDMMSTRKALNDLRKKYWELVRKGG